MSKYNCNEHPVAVAVIDMINSCEYSPELMGYGVEAIGASLALVKKCIASGAGPSGHYQHYTIQLFTANQYLMIWDESEEPGRLAPESLVDMGDPNTVRLINDHKNRVAARRREENAASTKPDTE